jgi:hypothetical protein
MNDRYENSYLNEETDDLIWENQRIDEFNEIKDYSRQLRSFLKYKEQVVKYRFRSSFTLPVHRDLPQLRKDKDTLHDIASKFINIIQQIKKNAESIKQGIQNLIMNPNSSTLRQLIEVMTELFILIHKFSEQELNDHPHLLKLVISLAREAYLVKRCLHLDIEEFLLELELSYEGLENEMEEMLSLRDHKNYADVGKQLGERLRS